MCVHVHCVCNFRAVKMLHLLAASRQDVPSFGEESCVCLCVCMSVKMLHLSAASRQDVMFWQFLVKISIFCVFYSLCICIVFIKMFQCVYASFCSRGSVILF